eukprot:UN31937
MDADLASIHNLEQNSFIAGINAAKQEDDSWIGLSTEESSDNREFTWSDTTSTGFFRWDSNEPNDSNDGEDCVEIRESGYWNDESCLSERTYICQKPYDPSIVIPTTTRSPGHVAKFTYSADSFGTDVDFETETNEVDINGIEALQPEDESDYYRFLDKSMTCGQFYTHIYWVMFKDVTDSRWQTLLRNSPDSDVIFVNGQLGMHSNRAQEGTYLISEDQISIEPNKWYFIATVGRSDTEEGYTGTHDFLWDQKLIGWVK